MAHRSQPVSLTANTPTDITFESPIERACIVNLSTTATVIWVNTSGDGEDAQVEGIDHEIIVGGFGAFSDEIELPAGTRTFSVVAEASVTIFVKRAD